mgnify:CR=1 FL=1|jgi:hypothetical protein
MFYRVQCVDRATGTETERLYHAGSPEQAAKMAMADGFVVGGVRPDGAPPPPPAPIVQELPQPPSRLAAYTATTQPDFGLAAFFNFEFLLLPVLIKWVFILATVGAVLSTIALPIMLLIDPKQRTREQALAGLVAIGVTWSGWIGLRLLSELWVVIFSIHDRLREIAHRTTRNS